MRKLVQCALALASALLLAGCAASGVPVPERPAASFAGFDTWDYPGEQALRVWAEHAPYEWVGYYLPSPCHRDRSWVGTRETLRALGWGIAVLYVGQQAFAGEPAPEEGARIICSRTLLTAEQGRADARDAIAAAAAEGFPPGTVIFLDIERMPQIPAAMIEYYRAWTATVLADGRYRPGTYAHLDNAAELFKLARAIYTEAGEVGTPRFWIAGGDDFALGRPPEAVGLPFADVWQGRLDVMRTWGGVTLRVDENVSDRPSPSAAERRIVS